MSNLLYIKKKDKTNNWSSVLLRQYEQMNQFDDQVYLYEVNTSSVKTYLQSIFAIFSFIKKQNIQNIYVNHIICAYPVLLSTIFLRSRKFVLALHEGEPVLGFRYAIKNRQNLSWKEMLRYTFLFQIPLPFFRHIIVLNKQQINPSKSKKYLQLNFLGVDEIRFQATKYWTDPVFCFPNQPHRPEKRFDCIDEVLKKYPNITFNIGGDVAYHDMSSFYQKSNITVISSQYETYSMVALEAMASNHFVILSSSVGLAENLLDIMSVEELEKNGVFIFDDIDQELDQIVYNLINNFSNLSSNTRALLLNLDLNENEVNQKLLSTIYSI